MEPEPAGAADVVVHLAGSRDARSIREAITHVVRGIGQLGDDLRVVVGCASDTGAEAAEGLGVPIVTLTSDPQARFPVISNAPRDAYRALFSAGRRTGARAVVVIGANDQGLTPDLVRALVQPIVIDGFDVVAPVYERHVFDGLLNAAVVYPLTRALYGWRIPGQIGLDFGFSARVAARWGDGNDEVPVARPTWLLPQAIADDFRICQAHVDVRLAAAPESADLGTLLSQVIGSLFTDVEYRAPFWQRVPRSRAVPTFGSRPAHRDDGEDVDVRPMIDSFGLAYRNLQSVWPLVLPPATLVELKRLTTADPARFRMADDLWARIVYDFAVTHRLRTISRDHLLKALVPLYLAWVASYATQVRGATRAMADLRLEQLCEAFETEKPYLVRRWRWPDRFNP